MTTVNYNIPSINCGHCVQTIKMELSDLAGVILVEADAASKQAKISFDAPATEESIKELLVEINFPAAE